MELLKTGAVSALIKSVLFIMLVACSWGSLAQEPTVNDADVQSVETEPVNINHADADTIATVLDGVGLTRAEAIVTFREEYGDFTSVDDLMMVKGIGEVTIRNNRDKILFD